MTGLDWVTSGLPAPVDPDSVTPRPQVLEAKPPAVCPPRPGVFGHTQGYGHSGRGPGLTLRVEEGGCPSSESEF